MFVEPFWIHIAKKMVTNDTVNIRIEGLISSLSICIQLIILGIVPSPIEVIVPEGFIAILS